MSDELKPCPFCGSEAKRVAGWVTCSNDDCIVSDVGTVTSKWNTRADHIPDASKMMCNNKVVTHYCTDH